MAGQEEREGALAMALATAPELTVHPGMEQEWADHLAANMVDPYTTAIGATIVAWGRLMQQAIADGATVAQAAEDTFDLANAELITGFQYGIVVGELAKYWVHGEALRQWHNREYGIEGENDIPGTVVNPAILHVGVADDGGLGR